ADVISNDFDIVVVTETWFQSKHADSLFNINGYSLFRHDRIGRRAGGVCIYAKCDLNASIVSTSHLTTCDDDDDDRQHHEVLWISAEKNGEHYLIGAVYHPPKPLYNYHNLVTRLSIEIEELTSANPNSTVYLTGDFNQLPLSDFLANTGLTQVVTTATRGKNILDLFLTNRPDTVFDVKVANSSLKSDHKALFVNTSFTPTQHHLASNVQVQFYDIREHYLIRLIKSLEQYNWSHISIESNIDLAYQAFLDISHWHIKQFIPTRTVSMPAKTPSYITPLVKSLLRRRNKLMHRGKICEANSLAAKIGKLISEFRSKFLANVDAKSSKQVWKMVNGVRGKLVKDATLKFGDQPVDIQALNKHFASIATDDNYDSTAVNQLIDQLANASSGQRTSQSLPYYTLETEDIQLILERIKKTSPGTDNLPYWFFKHCSFQLAPIITHLFNMSLSSGKPPSHWKKALVTPIPKTSNPSAFE